MMSHKTKRLYGRMQHGIQKKQEIINKLTEKRNNLTSPVTESNPQPTTNKNNKKVKLGDSSKNRQDNVIIKKAKKN